jgi:hypothetical protein
MKKQSQSQRTMTRAQLTKLARSTFEFDGVDVDVDGFSDPDDDGRFTAYVTFNKSDSAASDETNDHIEYFRRLTMNCIVNRQTAGEAWYALGERIRKHIASEAKATAELQSILEKLGAISTQCPYALCQVEHGLLVDALTLIRPQVFGPHAPHRAAQPVWTARL